MHSGISATVAVKERLIPASYPRGFRRTMCDAQTSRLLRLKWTKSNPDTSLETTITRFFHYDASSATESYKPFFADL